MRKLASDIDQWISSALGLTPVHKILFAFSVTMAVLIYFGYQFANEVAITPCSPQGTPARCYHISQRMCEVTWAKSEEPCRQYVHTLAMPPGRPIGATLFKCQFVDLDKAFVYSRKATPDCNDLFRDMEEWKRRNDFK